MPPEVGIGSCRVRFNSIEPGSKRGDKGPEAVPLLEALGLPVPDGLDGVSLMLLLRGAEQPELWAYGESGRSFMGMDPERRLQGVEGKRRMIRTAGWKLVHVPDATGGEDRPFDLFQKPIERASLVLAHFAGHDRDIGIIEPE